MKFVGYRTPHEFGLGLGFGTWRTIYWQFGIWAGYIDFNS